MNSLPYITPSRKFLFPFMIPGRFGPMIWGMSEALFKFEVRESRAPSLKKDLQAADELGRQAGERVMECGAHTPQGSPRWRVGGGCTTQLQGQPSSPRSFHQGDHGPFNRNSWSLPMPMLLWSLREGKRPGASRLLHIPLMLLACPSK